MSEKDTGLGYNLATAITSATLVAVLTGGCASPITFGKEDTLTAVATKDDGKAGVSEKETAVSVMTLLESRKSETRVSTSGVIDLSAVKGTMVHPDAPNAPMLAEKLDDGKGYYYFYQGEDGQGELVTIEMMLKDEGKGVVKIAYVDNAFNGQYGVKNGVVVVEGNTLVVAPVNEEGQVENPVMVIEQGANNTRMDLVDPGSGESVRLVTGENENIGGLLGQVVDAFSLMQGVAAAELVPTSTPETKGGVVTVTPRPTDAETSEPLDEPTATKTAPTSTSQPTQTSEPTETATIEPTQTLAPPPTEIIPTATDVVEPTITPVPLAPENQAVPGDPTGGVEVNHTNQRYNECGPTAIYMTLKALGFNVTIDQVVNIAKNIPPGEGGLDTTVTKNPVVFSSGAAERVIREMGGQVEGGDGMNLEWIRARLGEGKPVIVLVADESLKYFGHFVVVENVGDTTVEVDDPLSRADKVMTVDQFNRIWNVANLDKHDPLQPEGHQNFAIAVSRSAN